MKGLPLAYGKDMQEDKEPVFDAADSLALIVDASAGMIADMEPDPTAMRTAAEQGYATATDLADWLVRVAGLPFREAHRLTGAIVRRAEDRGVPLAELSLAELREVAPQIDEGVYDVLSVEASVASRASVGGTAPARVREAAAAARRRFLATGDG